MAAIVVINGATGCFFLPLACKSGVVAARFLSRYSQLVCPTLWCSEVNRPGHPAPWGPHPEKCLYPHHYFLVPSKNPLTAYPLVRVSGVGGAVPGRMADRAGADRKGCQSIIRDLGTSIILTTCFWATGGNRRTWRALMWHGGDMWECAGRAVTAIKPQVTVLPTEPPCHPATMPPRRCSCNTRSRAQGLAVVFIWKWLTTFRTAAKKSQ